MEKEIGTTMRVFYLRKMLHQMFYLISPTFSKINVIDLLLKEKPESHRRLPSCRSRILSSLYVFFGEMSV